MDVKALQAAGWTITQIAQHLGYHPATVSSWIKNGGPPAKRAWNHEEVVDDRWKLRIGQLLERNAELQATSVMRVIVAEGFDGSYQSLTRYLRGLRGPARPKASVVTVPIETAPGEEFQFDWSECNRWARRWGWGHELHCFGAVLCWCRIKHWWFATSIDQPHTLEGLVRFFEAVGGVPAIGRTDRMGQLGSSRGKAFSWHPVALELARHYGFALKACQAKDAARKGKVERPFRDLKAGFLAEMDLDPPGDIDELNRRVEQWLGAHVHGVCHRVTKVAPNDRFVTEQPLLGPLAKMRFDTARREPRHVGRVPMIEWDGVFYSAPPELATKIVEARQAVDSSVLELRFGGRLVAEHRVVSAGSEPQWLQEHRVGAEAIVLGRHRRHLRVLAEPEVSVFPPCVGLDLGEGDYEVESPDLALFGLIGPHPDDQEACDIASQATTAGALVACECLGDLR